MIVGIGHDVTDMGRIAALLEKKIGGRFMERILTGRERELSASYAGNRLIQFVSGRFAAKEAVVKALGCGIGETVGFTDIDILRDELGKPICELSEAAWSRLALDPERLRLHVTITHDRSIASAVAIAEQVKE
ncbi:holo-ACP synthase [Paenibacillus radicis (ex Gao et al. 2016)]|uniref:Holo-[acyl-carrier-protein] synthase n=1 Tax=Paenibacillus radicis (ex Gao et al. 2016) TaxID=1737354 RepID=A0A917LX35_9BACL|nr:holo-ACP synthase [Paenibacillus radicis (ex Gao et al. 2016)]GGG63003.1 holo-[acyl-carrier-protein] synthase [Paenibacillus radicis (ex Gao et al. 2016)]